MAQEDPRGGWSTLPPPAQLEGMEIRDAAGAPLGRVDDVYVDREEGGAVRYVAVGAEAPGHSHLVPVGVVRLEEEGAVLVTACEGEHLRGGPAVACDATVTRGHEEEVVAYFRDLHGAGYMRPWAEPPEIHGPGYMRPEEELPEIHGPGYMRPEEEPPEVHGPGYMRPEEEPPELHGPGYMRPKEEPPEVGGAGRMDPKFLSAVKSWRQ
jgi:sporulation protein YlmC with PRC-barrel domain